MNTLLFGIVLSGLLAASGVSAQTQSSPPAPVPVDPPSDSTPPPKAGQKIRCKKTAVTGSRMTQTVCHTEEEWSAMRDGARTFMRDIEKTRVSPRSEDGGM